MNQNSHVQRMIPVATLALLIGCDSADQRLANFAQQATAQQARQNEALAEQSQALVRQSQEVASTAHDLVQHDAVARRELIQAQEKLQEQVHVERSEINRRQEQLHRDRQDVAIATAREPLIARAILTVGILLAALLPLVVTAYAIRRLPDPCPASELFAGTLLDDLLNREGDGPSTRLTEVPVSHLEDAFSTHPPHQALYGESMSHIVQIQTQIRDSEAAFAACRRLGLPPPLQQEVQLFSAIAQGLAIQLPGWLYPVVCDLAKGTLQFDNYGGVWGQRKELDRLLQAYAVERARLEASRQGHTVTEQGLVDGSIKLTIQVSGGAA